MSGLYWYMKALDDAIKYVPTVRDTVKNCECDRHQQYRAVTEASEEVGQQHVNQTLQDEEISLMWEDLLCGHTIDLVKATCCPAVHEPSLRTRTTDEKSPRMIPWRCWSRADKKVDKVTGFPTGSPLCKHCGIESKLQISSCPALIGCNVEIALKEWRFGTRSVDSEGVTDRTQIELLDSPPTPVREVVTRFRQQLELCRTHYGQSRWMHRIRTIDTESIPDDTALVFTDFSATADLRAAQMDNCSEDLHMTIAVFCVLHSLRQVNVNGTVKWINNNDVWFFVGPTVSKGKKNDHVFHNASLDHLISHYKTHFHCKLGRELKTVLVWTDNCAGQYKCRQNFIKIAISPDKREVELDHNFAQKYGFKGPWDSYGKLLKYFALKTGNK